MKRYGFGVLRLLAGLLFVYVPARIIWLDKSPDLTENTGLLFTSFFFLLYSWSAVTNGIRELREIPPAFSLLRFFEIAMNGFVSVYLIILTIVAQTALSFRIMMLLGAFFLGIMMVRDARLVSRQVAEKRALKNKT